MKKLCTVLLVIVLCISVFSACGEDKIKDKIADGASVETNSSTITSETNPSTCSHNNTIVKNKIEATCTEEGYTGDTYCEDCDAKIATGQAIAKIEDTSSNTSSNKVKYTAANGTVYEVDAGTDIFMYTLKLNTIPKESAYRDIELDIFRLVNEERKKKGLDALKWCEEAYYFTNVRSEEALVQWGHERFDGRQWYTVYDDAGIITTARNENLASGGIVDNIAETAVEAWKNSKGHYDTMMLPYHTKTCISVSISEDGGLVCVAQHFFI